jgi:hypothetical protein
MKEAQELVRKYYLADDDPEKISKEEYDMSAEVLVKGTMHLRVIICLLFTIEQHTKTNEYQLSTSYVFPEKRSELLFLVHSRIVLLGVW